MLRFIVLAVLLMPLGSAPARAQTPQEQNALEVAGQLVEMAHGALIDPALDRQGRFAALRFTVDAAFAFDIWERFLLGDRADGFTDAEIAEFRGLLPDFLARLYLNQFGKGLDRKPEIIEARTVRGDVLVRARIPRASGGNLPVDWRIREIEGVGAKVIDVMVGGTSFLILKRDEFAALIDSGGAAGLLDYMRGFIGG